MFERGLPLLGEHGLFDGRDPRAVVGDVDPVPVVVAFDDGLDDRLLRVVVDDGVLQDVSDGGFEQFVGVDDGRFGAGHGHRRVWKRRFERSAEPADEFREVDRRSLAVAVERDVDLAGLIAEVRQGLDLSVDHVQIVAALIVDVVAQEIRVSPDDVRVVLQIVSEDAVEHL